MWKSRKRTDRTVAGIALMAGPLALILALGAFVGFAEFGDARNPARELPTGSFIPPFSLPALAGRDAGLARADLGGRVSVVNFWASWCAPCREEMPLLQELGSRPGIVIFGINSNDRPAAARRFLAEAGDPFTRIGVDADGAVARAWGTYGLPATFVIDAEGRVAHAFVGPLDRRGLDRDILPVINALSRQP